MCSFNSCETNGCASPLMYYIISFIQNGSSQRLMHATLLENDSSQHLIYATFLKNDSSRHLMYATFCFKVAKNISQFSQLFLPATISAFKVSKAIEKYKSFTIQQPKKKGMKPGLPFL